MDVDHSSNVERLEYLYLNMVGQVVQVHTIDGCISEGIFVSRTDPEASENEAGIFVSFPRFIQSTHHKVLDPAELFTGARLFCYKDIVMLEVVHLKLRTETPGMGNIHCYRGEHDLKTLDWAEECTAELLESEKMSPGEWDQFKANERFGVTSTYKEDFYTTKLDRAKLTKEQLEYADRVAKAIENSATRGVQHQAEREEIAAIDMDEGLLFSDVSRENVSRGGKKGPGEMMPQQQQQQQPQQSVRKAAPEPPGGKVMSVKRGAVDEGAPAPIEGGQVKDFNPNPAAAPFVPTRPIIRDYLRCIADAINNNDECYASNPDWPGEEEHYDRDDSSYSHQHSHQNQAQVHHPHHHHHHHQQQQQHQQSQPQQQQQQQQQPLAQAPGRGMAPQGQYLPMSGKGYGPMPHSFNRAGAHPVMHHQHHMPHHQYDMGNPNSGVPYMVGNNAQGPPVQQQQQQQPYMDQNMMGPSSSRMGSTMQPQQRSSNKGTQPQQPVVTALPMPNTSNMGSGRVQGSPPGQAPPGAIPEVDSGPGSAAVPEKQPPKKLRRGGASSSGMAPCNEVTDSGQGVKKK